LKVGVVEEKDKKQKAMWGTIRALVQRMVTGVQDGYALSLRMVGVGYRALMEDGKLSLKVGVSHPVLLQIPSGIKVSIPAPQRIILYGADWAKITQFAAQVHQII
jgi:large subunit ribosomal protein L6